MWLSAKEVFMPANNGRRNPFLTAPSLVLFVFLFLGIVGLIPVGSASENTAYVIVLILAVCIFGVPTAAFFSIRGGGAVRRFGFSSLSKNKWLLSLACGLVMSFQSAALDCAPGAETYDYTAYRLYGSAFDNTPDSFGSFILILFALVIVPSVLEEVFFRGILVYEYRFGGVIPVAVITASLYAMSTFSFASFPKFFVNGVMLALVSFLTGNLFCAMLSHGLYALFAVFAEKYFWFVSTESESRFLFWLILLSLLLVSLLLFLHFAEKTLRNRAEIEDELPVRVPKGKLFIVLYDMITAPMLGADMLCFVIFALLNLFL